MKLPTYFISHGGGPWPWLDGSQRRQYDQLHASLQGIVRELGVKPRAVLVISGQWSNAPAARVAHPEEDHLIPLMIAVGAAEAEPAERVYHETGFMGGVVASSYRLGAPAAASSAGSSGS